MRPFLYTPLLLVTLSLFPTDMQGREKEGISYLNACIERQVMPLKGNYLRLSYQENENALYHSPEPWQTLHYDRQGCVTCGEESFYREDTITRGEQTYVSKGQYTPNELLIRPYWTEKISNVTETRLLQYPLTVARYSPILLLNQTRTLSTLSEPEFEDDYAVYRMDLDGKTIQLYIRKEHQLLEKVVTTWSDDMLGDMVETISYSDFTTLEGLHYPQNIIISRIHDTQDSISLGSGEILGKVEPLLQRPEGYAVEAEIELEKGVHLEQLSDHIYGVNIPESESRAFLVEFSDFLVAIDVPFSSGIGEMVLTEGRRIAPEKPVRYFAFGHHHPWYLGGVRPFIRNGATILCREENIDYVRFLATAPHSIDPDSLYLSPVPLRTELVDSIMTISDGEYEMNIYHIGMKSAHTSDYLLFYFPSEKILIEGDLTWIAAAGPIGKAGARQIALYNTIRESGLDVETIFQTWPVSAGNRVKSAFSFSDLEASIPSESEAK